ncbi:hypothetical protein, partial [Levilactobacillus paucivorans]|uniref:hypothetical protein n=1 Tax=Levilactobacillus paucivorans TaxID=616990 RepID=UPI000A84D0C7
IHIICTKAFHLHKILDATIKTHKATKYSYADFDTWYCTLTKKQRNRYYQLVRDGDNTDAEGELLPFSSGYFL